MSLSPIFKKKILQIGGEFYTNHFFKKKNYLKGIKQGTWTFSGRFALETIFLNNKDLCKKNIYIPIFNCPSVYNIVRKYFKKIYFYDLTNNFNPKLSNIKNNSIVLKVNYFGLKNNFKKNCLIIEDLSHSLLDLKNLKKRNIYFMSLRKLGIFNLGGWTNVIPKKKKYFVNKVNLMKEFRKKKFMYLKKNIQEDIKEKKLLNDLKYQENKIIKINNYIREDQIQVITNKSLIKIKSIRKRNFNFLMKNIKIKFLKFNLNSLSTPMFFFLKFSNKNQRDKVRNKLIKKNIFCPIFWKIKNKNLKKYPNSKKFSENLLPIPIDHRIDLYRLKYMTRIINSL